MRTKKPSTGVRRQRNSELMQGDDPKIRVRDPDVTSNSESGEKTSSLSPSAVKRANSMGELDSADNLYNRGVFPHTSTGISTDKYLHGVLSDSTDDSSRAIWRSYTDDERTFGNEEDDGDEIRSPCVSFRDKLEDEDNGDCERFAPSPRSSSPLQSILRSISSPAKSMKENNATKDQPFRSLSPFGFWSMGKEEENNETSKSIPYPEKRKDDSTAASTADSQEQNQVHLVRGVSLRKEHLEPQEADDLEDEGVEIVDGRLSKGTFQKLQKKLTERASTSKSMASVNSIGKPHPSEIPANNEAAEKMVSSEEEKEQIELQEANLDEGVEVQIGQLSSQAFQAVRRVSPTKTITSVNSTSKAHPSATDTNKEYAEKIASSTDRNDVTSNEPVESAACIEVPKNVTSKGFQEKTASSEECTVAAEPVEKIASPEKCNEATNKGLMETPAVAPDKLTLPPPAQEESVQETQEKDSSSKENSVCKKTPKVKAAEKLQKNSVQSTKKSDKKRSRGKRRKDKKLDSVPAEIAFDAAKQEIPMTKSRTNRSGTSNLLITEETENKFGERDLDIIDIAPPTATRDAKFLEKSVQSVQSILDAPPIESSNPCSTIVPNDDIARMVGAMSCPADFGLFENAFQSNDVPEKNAQEASEYVKDKQGQSLLNASGFQKAKSRNVLCEKCSMAGDNGSDGKVCHNCLMLRVRSTVGSGAARRAERTKGKSGAKQKSEPAKVAAVNTKDPPHSSSDRQENIESTMDLSGFPTTLIDPRETCFGDANENVDRMCALFPKKLLSAYSSHLEGEGVGGGQGSSAKHKSSRSKYRSVSKRARERGPVPISEIEIPAESDRDILRTVSSLTTKKKKTPEGGAAKQRSVKLQAQAKEVAPESPKSAKGFRKLFAGTKRN